MKICNLLALDDFGGLQTLYVSLAKHFREFGEPLLTVNRAAKKPLEAIDAALSSDVYSPKDSRGFRKYNYLSAFPTTKARLEQAYLQRTLRSFFSTSGVSRVVGWNALPIDAYLPRSGDFVLYDHGLSSIQRPHSLNRARLKNVHSVISISHSNRRMLQERWGWNGEITVLPNPLRHQIALAPVLQKTWSGDAPFTAGVACRLVSFKGVASAIHATSIARSLGLDMHLRIAGDGPEEKSLKDETLKLGLTDYVSFEGIVHDMPNFFSSIDVLIAPSIREPFGLTPLEAMACGVPTIMSEVDGHPEVQPFIGAAKLIKPDLHLRDYRGLGSSLSKMPEFVFDPVRDTLVKPRALDPEKLAHALLLIAEDYSATASKTREAALRIRSRNEMAGYANSFLSLATQ